MAESVFGKPIDTAIQEINDKIGTVPSGQTVEGQIDALNSNITAVDSNFSGCKFYSNHDSLRSYNFSITGRTQSTFIAFLVFRRDDQYPNSYILGVGTGATPNVSISKLYETENGAQLTGATMSNNVLTLQYNGVAYGGVTVIQL